jgi:methionyl-tRNA synthetase
MEAVLYTTAEVLRAVGILVQPFIPSAAARLLDLRRAQGSWPAK